MILGHFFVFFVAQNGYGTIINSLTEICCGSGFLLGGIIIGKTLSLNDLVLKLAS